jgi:hypothetical protein
VSGTAQTQGFVAGQEEAFRVARLKIHRDSATVSITGIVRNGAIELPPGIIVPDGTEVQILLPENTLPMETNMKSRQLLTAAEQGSIWHEALGSY